MGISISNVACTSHYILETKDNHVYKEFFFFMKLTSNTINLVSDPAKGLTRLHGSILYSLISPLPPKLGKSAIIKLIVLDALHSSIPSPPPLQINGSHYRYLKILPWNSAAQILNNNSVLCPGGRTIFVQPNWTALVSAASTTSTTTAPTRISHYKSRLLLCCLVYSYVA